MSACTLCAQPIAVRSDLIAELSLPGSSDMFQRPGRVVYDQTAAEIYVADQGNNRIVVFDRDGSYRFEFSLGGRLGSIIDFAVSPSGFIYILGSTKDGRKVFTYDFDGVFIGEFAPMVFVGGDSQLGLSSVATDSEGRVYVLDTQGRRVLLLDPSGELSRTIPIFPELDEAEGEELVLGTLTTTDQGFLLPASSFGNVYHYSRSGELIDAYGFKGTTTGELAFPVSAATMSNGLVVVLDRQRFAVLCYSPDGKCLGEFGGKGRTAGWFYYPGYLASDGVDRTIISQVFENRVQICRIPQEIEARMTPATKSDGGELGVTGSFGDQALAGASTRQQHDKTVKSDLVGHFQHISSKGGL